MSEVLKFINKIIHPNSWKRKNLVTKSSKYLTIEEAIKRYEELSSI